MLIFDAHKDKKIQMALETRGVENDELKFTFTIDSGTISYGFPCIFSEGVVTINIPPLDNIIKDLKAGLYNARLDVTGNNSYYLNPFNEQIQIKQIPVISKVDVKDSDITEGIAVIVSKLIEVPEEKVEETVKEKVEEKVEETKKVKKSGISAFFDKR